MNRKESGKGPISLLLWAVLAIALAGGAYIVGAEMARSWLKPPISQVPALSTDAATPQQTAVPVAWLRPAAPVEGTLGATGEGLWQFRAQAGQSVILEMWLHPGSGSSVDAELAVHLIAPDGTSLASETGSGFLPPYLFAPSLPQTGLYHVQVVPISGEPGRYSLALTLTDVPFGTPGAMPTLEPLKATASSAAVVEGQFQWPTPRREISGWTFHDPGNPGHIGLDIGAQMWDPIVAVSNGTVALAEWGGGYGNLVIVEHADGWSSYYAHLAEIAVEMGQEVRQGELLGGAGSTGYSTGPHLHFELRYYGRPVDPHIYLP